MRLFLIVKSEELLEFAASFSLEELKAGVGSAAWRPGGWLDDRSSPDGNISRTREQKNPLTATQLLPAFENTGMKVFFSFFFPVPEESLSLTEPNQRIGNKNAPDANRRLV